MSSIPVLPGLGTQTADIAVILLPDGTAAPARVPISPTGVAATPMTEASALAFAAAISAFVAPLTPQPIPLQRGPFIFGFPA